MVRLGVAELDSLVKKSEPPQNRLDLNDARVVEKIASVMALSEGISLTLEFTVNGLLFWRKESSHPLFGIFFWSTFITSVWVWLYALGGWVIKAVEYLGFGTAKFRRWLDIENKPMLAIGYMCMMLVTLGFVFMLIF